MPMGLRIARACFLGFGYKLHAVSDQTVRRGCLGCVSQGGWSPFEEFMTAYLPKNNMVKFSPHYAFSLALAHLGKRGGAPWPVLGRPDAPTGAHGHRGKFPVDKRLPIERGSYCRVVQKRVRSFRECKDGK